MSFDEAKLGLGFELCFVETKGTSVKSCSSLFLLAMTGSRRCHCEEKARGDFGLAAGYDERLVFSIAHYP